MNCRLASLLIVLTVVGMAPAEIYRTDGTPIPGTEGLTASPGVVLDGLDLIGANLVDVDLTGASLRNTNLSESALALTTVDGADFTNARIDNASWMIGLHAEQLYSTWNYQNGQLQNIRFSEEEWRGIMNGWDFSGQDLTNAEFDSAQLAGANFSAATLNRVYLGGADLTDAIFRNATMVRTHIDGGNFVGADFNSANLSDTSFSDASMPRADFSNANLTGTLFVDPIDLRDAIFTNASIEGATFGFALGLTAEQIYSTTTYQQGQLRDVAIGSPDFENWNFREIDLSGAYLAGQSFDNADFTDAQIDEIRIDGGQLAPSQIYSTANYQRRDLRGIDVRGHDFSDWSFSEIDLADAILTHSEFIRTNFENANLSQADLRSVDAASANFQGANLENVNFAQARLHNARLDGSIGLPLYDQETTYNQWTVFPDGFDPAAAQLTMEMSSAGDFDADGTVGPEDIDTLSCVISGCQSTSQPPTWINPAMFDLNLDDVIDARDLQVFTDDLTNTPIGDVNFDGRFTSTDLTLVSSKGEYEDEASKNSSWTSGDWSGDGEFSSRDLVVAFQASTYESDSNARSVPEPSSLGIWLFGALALVARFIQHAHE